VVPAESVETGDEIKSYARSSRTTVTESFVFTCLTYKCAEFELVLTNTQMLKNLHEQNLKGEAYNKQLNSEDTQRSDFRS